MEGYMKILIRKPWVAMFAAVALQAFSAASAQTINDGYSFSTLSDGPDASVTPYGISGSTIVGEYTSNNRQASLQGEHGFVYNDSSFTTLDDPLANDTQAGSITFPQGISGSTVVGSYTVNNDYHGFTYNGSTFTTLDDPAGTNTSANGISDGTIVGTYDDSNLLVHGFIYNGSTFTSLNDPSAVESVQGTGTFVDAVSGNDIVGYYTDAVGHQGFFYNGATWTTLDDPLAPDQTFPTGVSGNTVVGYYNTADGTHGFVYNGSTFTTVDDPLATGTTTQGIPFATQILGISENGTIVGIFGDSSGGGGFIATPVVPEPASASLLSAGALLLLRRRQKLRRPAAPAVINCHTALSSRSTARREL
jgi:hypothetical protein